MNISHNSHYQVPVAKVRIICNQLFQKVGLSKQHAETVADNLIFADLHGVSSHGVTRTASYCNRALSGFYNVSPNVQIIKEKGNLTLLEGDNGFGAVVGKIAMEIALAKAKDFGCSICSVRNSNHFGAASYYTSMASRKDMIGFCCTNGPANMAPYGSKESMLGTNPFSVAIPAGKNPPLVLDIATSIVARGNILDALKEGQAIPDGWAIDKEGNNTNNAALAVHGSVLPFGGYKGSGIAIMIDAISGVLSGAEYGKHVRQPDKGNLQDMKQQGAGIGQFFLAIDISPLQEVNLFKSKMDQMIDELKSASLAPNVTELFVPGEIEARKSQLNQQNGIILSGATINELAKLCEDQHIENILEPLFKV